MYKLLCTWFPLSETDKNIARIIRARLYTVDHIRYICIIHHNIRHHICNRFPMIETLIPKLIKSTISFVMVHTLCFFPYSNKPTSLSLNSSRDHRDSWFLYIWLAFGAESSYRVPSHKTPKSNHIMTFNIFQRFFVPFKQIKRST